MIHRRIARRFPVFACIALSASLSFADPGAEKKQAPAQAGSPSLAAAEDGAGAPESGRSVIILAQQARPQSPFEEIPEAAPPGGQRPASPFEDIPDSPDATPDRAESEAGDFVEQIQFRGVRRVPREGLAARIFTKIGDPYDENGLRRDFMVLWNTGYFDDLRLEVEDGERGRIVRFVVTERRVVRTIRYEGNKSATVSDILERFKERGVGLSVESRYDPTRVQIAMNVLKELLGERGRQYAVIRPQIRQIPPSSIEIVFDIDEGPKVKVGKVTIEGNTVINDRTAKRVMKEIKPIGLPYSIILEDLFAKTFDIRKLEASKERLRNEYQKRGYFKASVTRHELETRDAKGRKLLPIPFIFKRKAKIADIDIFMDEDRQYRLGKLSFTDVSLFRSPESILAPVFQMREGDVFDVEKLRKGLDNLKKLYGEFGYIDFVAEPTFEFRDDIDPPLLDLNLTVDEQKQFFVRRIDFAGNTTTRDKVIRRELLVDEGDMFNTRLWDVSILRLNQLGYFEPLKEDESTDIRRDTRRGLVDLTLNIKERGKNTVNLNGGVSGFAGSFIGFGYSTNNFLGLGETLTFETQLGSRERVLMFGFTEPYLFDKPIQAGFTVFTRRFSFNQGREASIFSGQNLIPLFNQLGSDNILDYRQNTTGFTTFVSYPLRKSFSRLSMTYSYQRDKLLTFGSGTANLFRFLNFEGVSGPNSLEGIDTSEITPGFFHNTVDHPITPTKGTSLFANVGIAGLGGNTRFIQPTIEAKWFKPVGKRNHVIGMRLLASYLTGYGGKVPPPFRRAFMGGENDIRGFDIFSVSPMVWIPDNATVNVLNADGSPRQQVLIVDGVEELAPVTQEIPVYRLAFPGGDTRGVYNFEYRIPIFGPVTVAPFFDVGVNRISMPNQVRLNPGRVAELNGQFPQAGFEEQIRIITETQKVRMSTGVEMQVMMPVVNAPFRFYWAYNPMRVSTVLQPPIVADRSLFPNSQSFVNGVRRYGTALPFFERARTFRFTISRTF